MKYILPKLLDTLKEFEDENYGVLFKTDDGEFYVLDDIFGYYTEVTIEIVKGTKVKHKLYDLIGWLDGFTNDLDICINADIIIELPPEGVEHTLRNGIKYTISNVSKENDNIIIEILLK